MVQKVQHLLLLQQGHAQALCRHAVAKAVIKPRLIAAEIRGEMEQAVTPVFMGTRVTVKNLLDYLAAGDSLGKFLEDFPSVRRDEAVAALEIARDLLTARAHPAR
jgi:uncharacterized protein (DUF433 family)